jgi:hypothetical protein
VCKTVARSGRSADGNAVTAQSDRNLFIIVTVSLAGVVLLLLIMLIVLCCLMRRTSKKKRRVTDTSVYDSYSGDLGSRQSVEK